MIDITALSSLVSAFRAETQKDSITPEKLGDILQKILDLLTTAAKDGDLSAIANWKSTISAIGKFVTALSAGTVDADSVHLSFNTVNSATGAAKSYADTISIQKATTERAGVMTAQQVKDLEANTKNVSDYMQSAAMLYQAMIALEQSISEKSTKEQNARESADKSLEQKISSVEQSVSNIDVSYNNRLSSLERETDNLTQSISALEAEQAEKSNTPDMYHIECHVVDHTLNVLGAQDLLNKGLVPVLFRYTVKQNRESRTTAEKLQHNTRLYKKKMRGWHLFYDTQKVRFDGNHMVVRRDLPNQEKTYFNDPRYLLGKFIFDSDDEGKLTGVRVGFGKKMYSVMTGHIFKFALAFADMKIKSYTFDFRNLKTNLAVFKVYVYSDSSVEDFEQSMVVNYAV